MEKTKIEIIDTRFKEGFGISKQKVVMKIGGVVIEDLIGYHVRAGDGFETIVELKMYNPDITIIKLEGENK